MKNTKKIYVFIISYILVLILLSTSVKATVEVENENIREATTLSELLNNEEKQKELNEAFEENQIEIPDNLQSEEEIDNYIKANLKEENSSELYESTVNSYNTSKTSNYTDQDSSIDTSSGIKINGIYYQILTNFNVQTYNSKYEYYELYTGTGKTVGNTTTWKYYFGILKRDVTTNKSEAICLKEDGDFNYVSYFARDNKLYILYTKPEVSDKCYELVYDIQNEKEIETRTFSVMPGAEYHPSFVVDGNEITYIIYEKTGLKSFDKNGKLIYTKTPLTNDSNKDDIIYLKGISPNNQVLFFEVMKNTYTGYNYYETVYEGVQKVNNGKFANTDEYTVYGIKYGSYYSKTPVWNFINNDYAINQYGQIAKFNYNEDLKSTSSMGVSYEIVQDLNSDTWDYGGYVQSPAQPTFTKYGNYYYIVGVNYNIYIVDASTYAIKNYINAGIEVNKTDAYNYPIKAVKIINNKLYLKYYEKDRIIDLNTATYNYLEDIVYSEHSSTKHTIADIKNKYKQSVPTFNYSTSIYESTPSYKAPYSGGSLKQGVIDDTLKKLNYYRWMIGVDDVSIYKSRLTYNQKGSTLLKAINELTHYPSQPTDMDDSFYKDACAGVGAGKAENGLYYSGNIAQGYGKLSNSVEGWVADTNNVSINSITGHRQSLLDPYALQTSFGQAGEFSAMSMYYNTTKDISSETYYAYPPAGNFPSQEMQTDEAWSIYYVDPKLSGVISATFEYKGKTYQAGISLESGYRVFNLTMPDELVTALGGKGKNITPGTEIKVTVKGFKDKELNNVSFTYTVKFFDMSDAIKSASLKTQTIDITKYLFNATFYADLYPDLKKEFGYNEAALKNHWLTNGIKEGRIASPIFDAKYYLNTYSDLKKAFGNNYEAAYNHFITNGINEGRKASKFFDVKYYLNNNSDLNDTFGTNYGALVEHFYNNGLQEGRDGSDTFKLSVYKANYEDLRKAFGNNNLKYYIHYIASGEKEGRKCTEKITTSSVSTQIDITKYLFNAKFYADLYPDLKKEFGYNEAALKNHWLIYGIKEGRIASPIFDSKYYLNTYSDLKKEFGNNYKAAYNHFITYGISEGRKASNFFDVKYYLNTYSDLKKAFGTDYKKALEHFYNNGLQEGRDGSDTFEISVYKASYEDLRKAFGNNNLKYYIHYITNGKNEGRKTY
jgi:hypothetical protein